MSIYSQLTSIMNEFQHGTVNRIRDWRVGRLLHLSGHLCRFHQELHCDLCKGKSERREPPNEDQAMLRELEITAMTETLSIPKQAKAPSTQTIYVKALSAKLPQLHFKMTPSSNNSGSFESIGKCSSKWQTCQLLRPTSSCTDEPIQMQLDLTLNNLQGLTCHKNQPTILKLINFTYTISLTKMGKQWTTKVPVFITLSMTATLLEGDHVIMCVIVVVATSME